MKIRKQTNIMSEELPADSVRKATEINDLLDLATRMAIGADGDDGLRAQAVLDTITWLFRKRAKPPL